MASDSAELARTVFDAFNRRDIETLTRLIADGAEIYPIRAQLEGNVYRGPEGMAAAVAAADGDWENLRFEVDAIREGSDGVVALTRFQGRGIASGVEIDVPTGWHFRIAEGKVTYSRAYSRPEEALRVAGA